MGERRAALKHGVEWNDRVVLVVVLLVLAWWVGGNLWWVVDDERARDGWSWECSRGNRRRGSEARGSDIAKRRASSMELWCRIK